MSRSKGRFQNKSQKDPVRVQVTIFGEEYTVKGTEEPEYIEMLAAYVDRKMETLAQKNPSMGLSKLAVLTALNLADELSKLQDDYEQLVKLIEERDKEKGLDLEW